MRDWHADGWLKSPRLQLPSRSELSVQVFHHRNLDACAPPAPRGPAPFLLRPAQAQLNFAPVLPTLLTLLTGPRRSQELIPLQIVNF